MPGQDCVRKPKKQGLMGLGGAAYGLATWGMGVKLVS